MVGQALLVSARAPGRVALLGEHCDWAGGASLAAPLPMGVTATARAGGDGLSATSALEGQRLSGRWPASGEVDPHGGPLRFVPACAVALAERGLRPGPLHLDIDSDLPAGRGFSSSAALSVAVLDAMAGAAGARLGPIELAELAYRVERELLGIACGRLDQLSSALGREGGGSAVLLRWSDGQPIEARPVAPGAPLPLVVAAFAAPRDTPGILATLNQCVAGAHPDPTAVAGAREALALFAREALLSADAVAAGDLAALGASMNRAQDAYERCLHARLPALRAPGLVGACASLRQAGALGAKFSGAGGDGSVVALAEDPRHAARLRAVLAAQGLATWDAQLGG